MNLLHCFINEAPDPFLVQLKCWRIRLYWNKQWWWSLKKFTPPVLHFLLCITLTVIQPFMSVLSFVIYDHCTKTLLWPLMSSSASKNAPAQSVGTGWCMWRFKKVETTECNDCKPFHPCPVPAEISPISLIFFDYAIDCGWWNPLQLYIVLMLDFMPKQFFTKLWASPHLFLWRAEPFEDASFIFNPNAITWYQLKITCGISIQVFLSFPSIFQSYLSLFHTIWCWWHNSEKACIYKN